ncbi:MAG: hypothetical protein ACRENU_07085 [Gemmatimonadaceae bacterium]
MWVRRAMIASAAIYMAFFCWSICRRIWQVLRIELHASSMVLRPGVTVGYDVVTSGEVRNLIRLELVQGVQNVMLLEQLSRRSSMATFDVRLHRYTPTVSITPGLLSRFQPGPATLRVKGFGSRKLLRTPGPRVAELRVQLAP